MAETCPKMYSCSTNRSGWLSGTHPTVAEGIVQRKVCFSQLVSQFFSDCCNQTKSISVRNCGAFYVYRLDPPDSYSRYCGNGLPQAPGKNELKTSSLLLLRMTCARVEWRANAYLTILRQTFLRETKAPDSWSMRCFSARMRHFLETSLEMWITLFGDKQPY